MFKTFEEFDREIPSFRRLNAKLNQIDVKNKVPILIIDYFKIQLLFRSIKKIEVFSLISHPLKSPCENSGTYVVN